ncbi:5-dehydro-4-deoxy-D-glucuronate isomerase [Chryseosolibacter indicus]|uniref:4-deoxy-L-threo-5-hexosulose-uronate ketol-isomerase n=1 Tax=Chryseosolibacter indicus TaxID=2782351 RepID=A0ABS5VVK2_9BACT|nr:5-dehydro-4-deoxy-D-glucuronate isomerase [Chryseosolibacter indicus]MBT1704026.1 5-dehydro-4-deoxy-D-glucuronate isomerase [Chryseosolibacter indicus]
MNKRFSIHPNDFKHYTTDKIRKEFLIEDLFQNDAITHTYTHYDRLIVGGAMPVNKALKLETIDVLKSTYFLERREIGIINVGASGSVTVDGTQYPLNFKEALYIGKECKEVVFHPSTNGRALYYFNSAPAHAKYPTRKVTFKEAETVEMGSLETSNSRTIRKLIINTVVPTCQLQMGLTELKPGSVWNTMPPHTHDRRMEAYFYFEIPENQMVCHFLGEPQETRHIWMKNNQAVLSPPWSIHSGAGTSNYTFIWGMAGENLDYSDMDAVKTVDLR